MILKALSLDPRGRYQSAEEFQEALTRVAARHRLLIGGSEMAAHLRTIAGDDASMWLKPEVSGYDRGEPTQAHGTAVLSTTQGIVDGEDERKVEFDLSDADEEEEEDQDSDVDNILRSRNRAPSVPTRELTSVIAVRQQKDSGESEVATRVREDVPSLPEPQPRRTEPIAAAAPASRRGTLPQFGEFPNDESRQETVMRDSGSPRHKPAPAGAVSDGRSTQGNVPPADQATKINPPSPAGSARHHEPAGVMSNPFGGSPLAAASGYAGSSGAKRRLPTSGIRRHSHGEYFEGTEYVRRPRRIIGIMIVLLLIGIGVALGVAFSGPELEVVDPSVVPEQPGATPSGAATGASRAATGSSGAATGRSGGMATGTSGTTTGAPAGSSAPRQPPRPSELPGPPAATPGTP